MPQISVVIPVYKVERFLPQCVESVLAQTFHDFEVILVDDGSPDRCPALCDEYAAKYPNFRVVHKHNEGLGLARNSGMQAARGRYVMFLDSDDILRHDALERLHQVAEEHGAQTVQGRLIRFTDPDKITGDVTGGEPLIIRGPQAMRRAALCSFSHFPGDESYTLTDSSCCALYRLDMLRDNGIDFPSERQYISEDYVFKYRVALHSDCIVQLPDTFYRYRVNPQSLTQALKADVMERTVDYCQKIEDLMLTDGFGTDATKYAFGYAASRIRARYKYMFLRHGPWKEKLAQARQWRALPYFQRMQREFDPSALSRLHRLNYSLFVKCKFRTLSRLIHLQSLLRKMRGQIDA